MAYPTEANLPQRVYLIPRKRREFVKQLRVVFCPQIYHTAENWLTYYPIIAEVMTKSRKCKYILPFFFCVFNNSAGVGRTGCFIVIDAMLERIKHEKTVDIYGHVTLMRAQRNYMVQTEDQYVFIHDALQEAVNCGTTEVPARNLYAYIQKLTQIEGGENVTGMELEFKVHACISVIHGLF